jgi:hypothetical protein
MELWSAQTPDPDAALKNAISLESEYSSLFGSISILEGPGATTKTTASGPTPTSGGNPGKIKLFYYSTNVASEAQWEIYEGDSGFLGCPEVETPDFIKKSGSFAGIHNGDSGFTPYGKSCKYEGKNLPTGEVGVEVGKFVCDGYRDATCYTGNGNQGTCQYGYTNIFSVMRCEW